MALVFGVLCGLAVVFPCFVTVSGWVVSPFWIWLATLIVAVVCGHMALRCSRSEETAYWVKRLTCLTLVLAYLTIPIQLVLNTFTMR